MIYQPDFDRDLARGVQAEVRIIRGDCRDVLHTFADESVHCVVTSPPYWGLRDYGVGGQIGLEPTLAEYIETMRGVFREVWRVLRKDGTLWLNMGDSYATAGGYGGDDAPSNVNGKQRTKGARNLGQHSQKPGFKHKDLCGIPWRLAFALQADGWYLRSDIIWSKPNPMPESVTDRPTKSHEYLFLLSKSERYYYDGNAVREPVQEWNTPTGKENAHGIESKRAIEREIADGRGRGWKIAYNNPLGRNRRTVWEIPTAPFPEAHFATFPPALVEPCILAGCPAKCCAKCGAPWIKNVQRIADGKRKEVDRGFPGNPQASGGSSWRPVEYSNLGPMPSCECDFAEGEVKCGPGAVLDPFGGAGTTGLVADRLGRNAILIELNPEYATMAERRIRSDAPLLVQITT
jgi:DNA modification methylase